MTRTTVHALRNTLVLSAAALAVVNPAAAAVVDLTTGTALWQLTSFTPTHAPYASQVASGTFGQFNVPAPTISPHANWNTSLNSSASWIAPTTTGASYGVGGLYEYTLDLSNSLTPGATYSLSAQYIADNGLVGAFFNGDSQTISAQTTSLGWKELKNLSFDFVAAANSVLKLQIYNADNTGQYGPADGMAPSSTANPTGFILSGSLEQTAPAFIPEPSATLAMGALATLVLRRR
jgi:hypothetical protein